MPYPSPSASSHAVAQVGERSPAAAPYVYGPVGDFRAMAARSVQYGPADAGYHIAQNNVLVQQQMHHHHVDAQGAVQALEHAHGMRSEAEQMAARAVTQVQTVQAQAKAHGMAMQSAAQTGILQAQA